VEIGRGVPGPGLELWLVMVGDEKLALAIINTMLNLEIFGKL
jgi:hypothetical protein